MRSWRITPVVFLGTMAANDLVNSPAHYVSGGIECIDALEASSTPEEFQGYCKCNAQKYLWRYRDKGGVQDLHKANWYLHRLIKHHEQLNDGLQDLYRL